ncbi:heme/hemin ABC transporter substrate-binding protein [Stappia albiluteola]|uniref:heme/hemin ABC transporter substrate-binding protein n=1 Tax=Stappia albiluteola TaxID=2758565 RepID=UPI002E27FAB5|nr:ABC transporter substrate-binding protein [Stappia albiluteola]
MPPSRIVSIGGSITEIVYALGQEKRLVAVDTTSTYPAEAAELPNVGYMRALSAEGVLSLKPDLVIAVEGAGPPQAIDVLKSSSIPFLEVPDQHSAAGVAAKIRIVGKALGVEARAEDLAAQVALGIAQASTPGAGQTDRPKVAFLLSVTDGRLLVSGAGTAADSAIRLAGGKNAFPSFENYKPVSGEALVAANPDAIVVMRRKEHDPTQAVRAIPGIHLTSAIRSDRLIAMDGLYLLGFGPRTPGALRELAEKLRASDD